MKKVCVLFMLLLALAATPSNAAYVSLQGITVDVPSGWTVESGEEMLVYNQNESSVVIISTIAKNAESSLREVVRNLGQAVGVPKKEVRYDAKGSALLSFMQNGERVNVRLVEEDGTILMVCSIGKDALAERVAASVTTRSTARDTKKQLATAAPNSNNAAKSAAP